MRRVIFIRKLFKKSSYVPEKMLPVEDVMLHFGFVNQVAIIDKICLYVRQCFVYFLLLLQVGAYFNSKLGYFWKTRYAK